MANQVIFNITFKVPLAIADSWISDMKNKIIPSAVDGKLILAAQMSEVVSSDEDGRTFSVQFYYPNKKLFGEEKLNTMRVFLSRLDEKYRGQYVYFPTTLDLLYIYNPST